MAYVVFIDKLLIFTRDISVALQLLLIKLIFDLRFSAGRSRCLNIVIRYYISQAHFQSIGVARSIEESLGVFWSYFSLEFQPLVLDQMFKSFFYIFLFCSFIYIHLAFHSVYLL